MKLIKYVNSTHDECEEALVDISTKEPNIIVNGDTYHNRIEEVIAGFITALNYMGIQYDYDIKSIGIEDEWFEKLDFYDGSED